MPGVTPPFWGFGSCRHRIPDQSPNCADHDNGTSTPTSAPTADDHDNGTSSPASTAVAYGRVIGPDVYGLDRDGDGVGCE
jgi:hypothetical protein